MQHLILLDKGLQSKETQENKETNELSGNGKATGVKTPRFLLGKITETFR